MIPNKAKPAGQLDGRNERIRRTEQHFGMTCVDRYMGNAPVPEPPSPPTYDDLIAKLRAAGVHEVQ